MLTGSQAEDGLVDGGGGGWAGSQTEEGQAGSQAEEWLKIL
jgi:hypothetical protein